MKTHTHRMTSHQPATRWQDALPTGNGVVGALVYGNICHELVVLNHDDLWLRSPAQPVPDVAEHLPAVRALLAAGRYQEAAMLLDDRLREKGYSHRVDPYHPAFDLDILTRIDAPFTDYRRTLDFETGEVCVQWRELGEERERRLFVSRADDAVVMRIAGSRSRPVSCRIALIPHDRQAVSGMGSGKGTTVAPVPIDFRVEAEGAWVRLVGQYQDGSEFGGLARVIHQGGTCETSDGAIQVANADAILVLVKLFANEPSAAALERLAADLDKLPVDYTRLCERHAQLHRELFLRAQVPCRPATRLSFPMSSCCSTPMAARSPQTCSAG